MDGNLRAVREGGALVFDRDLGAVLPQTEVRRLQAYVDWQNTNSPGSVAPIEDFGIAGAVASDTFALDSDMNFDRLLIKARVPASMASTSDSLIIGIEIDGSLSKTKTFGLMEDPLDNSFLLTDKPFLLYDDPNGELDTGAVVSYLPESTELLDPPVVATASP